jgi:hypothetical protein
MKRITYFFSAFIFLSALESKAQVPIHVANESEINTSFQEYSPAYYKDGLVFITSNPAVAKNKESDENTGKGTTSIFLSKQLDNGLLAKPSPFAESLTTRFYDGPLSFNDDGTIIYFTRSNLKRGKPITAKDGLVKLKVYTAQLKGDKWENTTELPFNNNEYDCTHPSVSPDGRRLYFASNRPGGFGGMDLYVSTLIDNKWSEPVNLGPKVNTPKNEVFPFIHADGKVYFSSNGRNRTVGGLDIYFTSKTDTGWMMPKLLPEPINSRSDDFGLIVSPNKKSGYFSSNRSSGKGDDDIFSYFSSQTIDSEFIITEEVVEVDATETDKSTEISAEIPVGEVKSIEKTNIVETVKTDEKVVDESKSSITEAAKIELTTERIVAETPKTDNISTEVTVAETPKTVNISAEVAVAETPKSEVIVPVKTVEPTIGYTTQVETPVYIPENKPTVEVVESTTITPSVSTATAGKDLKIDIAVVKKEKLGTIRAKYLIVVGTYATEKNALIQQRIVKNKGYNDVEVIHYKEKNLYGVCVKQCDDEKEASAMAKTVAKSGIEAFVKVLK